MLFRSVQQHQLEIPEPISREWLTTNNRWYAGEQWSVIANVSGWLIKAYSEDLRPTTGINSIDLRGELVGFGIVPDRNESLRNVMILGKTAFYAPTGEMVPVNPGGIVLVDLDQHLQYNPVLVPPSYANGDGYEQQLIR